LTYVATYPSRILEKGWQSRTALDLRVESRSGILVCMDIIGGVVLIDPDTGSEYAVSYTPATVPNTWGAGLLGGVVLIDPATGDPYKP